MDVTSQQSPVKWPVAIQAKSSPVTSPAVSSSQEPTFQ
jgi:hypothetical protein